MNSLFDKGITIGIATFNRPALLKAMRDSLYASSRVEDCNIRVYDDCSTEFDNEYLREVFHSAADIVRRENNLKSDANLRQMYVDFLNTGDEIFIEADSDLIFDPGWLLFVNEIFEHTDGIVSLYNSVLHESVRETLVQNHPFEEKMHMGSAGVVFHRRILEEIVNEFPDPYSYDCRWSRYLRKKNVRLLVSKRSYVQHIGLHGQNCDGSRTLEFGLNFEPKTEANKDVLIDYYERALLLQAEWAQGADGRMRRQSMCYRVGFLILWPLRIFVRLWRKIHPIKGAFDS